MRIHDDLTKTVLVNAAELDWVPSPAAGVDRRMLFRIGEERARATSIVRYAPGSAFPRHTHGGGEEFVVLDGVFQDEHGDYPAGSYIRNPPETSHVPASEGGCTIFVRLWQFRESDRTQIALRPGEGRNVATRPGSEIARVLFDDSAEEVRIETWSAGATVRVENERGTEFLVLSGSLTVHGTALGAQGWGRIPAGVPFDAEVGTGGATVWMKQGALIHPDVCRIEDA